MTAAFDLRVLSGLENGEYSGKGTVAYGNASTSEHQVDLPVKLTLALPRVRTVMPYATEAGRSLSHILRGEGFSSLQSGQSLRFGSTTMSTFQVISDSELRLTVPALPVGAHAVTVDNALGLSRPGPNLYAVQTPAMTEFSLPRTQGARRVIYDPRRIALYTVDDKSDGAHSGLRRYRYADGTWTEDAYVTLPNVHDAVMDVDGQSLYISIGNGLYRLELDDPTATPRYLKPNWGQYNRFEVLNDGYLLSLGDSCYHATTSLDGRRSVIMDAGCYSPPGSIRALDAGSTQLQSTSLFTYGPPSLIALDRTARYAFVQNAIYNSQWLLVANAAGLHGLIFSHDAQRFFALYDDPAKSRQMLRAYDASNPPSAGRFPKLDEFQVTGAHPGDGLTDGGIALTPDDRTLIIVNSRQFRVIPLPASMR